jgi:prevent-host-death family protein
VGASCVHIEVGARELKRQLSRYLDLVAAGEEITVTDGCRPKARRVPVVDRGLYEQGVQEGWIRPPVSDRTIGESRRHRSKRLTTEVLDDDRDR